MNQEQIAALKAAAENATQGEWGFSGIDVATVNAETKYVELWHGIATALRNEDARYIAQANPAAILALLAERDALIARAEAAEKDTKLLDYLVGSGAVVIHDSDGSYLFWFTSGRCGHIRSTSKEAIDAAMKQDGVE